GALDMSLPSPPEVRIKEEEPLEVDSSPPESPGSGPRSPLPKDKEPPRPLLLSTPTPTIVRPGSLPLHLGYEPLQPTLPSPTSVITQAPPSNRQLGEAQGPGPAAAPGLAQPAGLALLSPGLAQLSLGAGHCCPLGQPSWGQQWPDSAQLQSPWPAVGVAAGWQELLAAPPDVPFGPLQRLKATLAASSSLNGSGLVAGSASSMVTARPEQSQALGQHPDTPSPAQPQVSPAQPTGGRRRRAAAEDPDERRQRFLERNRAAASRCRQKRKLWVSSLEKKAEELSSQNLQLSNEVTLLRNEVAQLKQLLLAHKDCPVTALQKKTQGYLGEW
ncbi:ATF7 factor, partial [Alaudala cheleensis]|nr:ATF7 factor [Alaudala cheleensis]